eukprot:755529-Hanusia_phi.AAC.1
MEFRCLRCRNATANDMADVLSHFLLNQQVEGERMGVAFDPPGLLPNGFLAPRRNHGGSSLERLLFSPPTARLSPPPSPPLTSPIASSSKTAFSSSSPPSSTPSGTAARARAARRPRTATQTHRIGTFAHSFDYPAFLSKVRDKRLWIHL